MTACQVSPLPGAAQIVASLFDPFNPRPMLRVDFNGTTLRLFVTQEDLGETAKLIGHAIDEIRELGGGYLYRCGDAWWDAIGQLPVGLIPATSTT
jgi:hypothetical protein